MFVPDHVLKADVILVLGMTLWQRPLLAAREIYELGGGKIVVLTGGFNQNLHACEAEMMLDGWRAWGLDSSNILLENQATNTRENMQFSKNMLEAHGIYKTDMSVNLVSINYHMRRAMMTFRDVFGPTVNLGVANYLSRYCDPNGWDKDPKGRGLILEEARKIKHYFPSIKTPCHLLS